MPISAAEAVTNMSAGLRSRVFTFERRTSVRLLAARQYRHSANEAVPFAVGMIQTHCEVDRSFLAIKGDVFAQRRIVLAANHHGRCSGQQCCGHSSIFKRFRLVTSFGLEPVITALTWLVARKAGELECTRQSRLWLFL